MAKNNDGNSVCMETQLSHFSSLNMFVCKNSFSIVFGMIVAKEDSHTGRERDKRKKN
jgi:hypothetical protein